MERALPNGRVHSLQILKGGATNSNTLIRMEMGDELFILRTHLRGAEICEKEVHLLKALQELIPVPSLVQADPTGDQFGTPYLTY